LSVIYRSEDGDKYTQKSFEREVAEAMQTFKQFRRLPHKRFKQAVKVASQLVLLTISWEHPASVVDQFDDEDVQYILDKIRGDR